MRNNVLEFTKGMPEVMIGNALIAEVSWQGLPGQVAGPISDEVKSNP